MVDESSDRPGELPAKVVAALERIARGHRRRRLDISAELGLTPLQSELLLTVADGVPPEPAVGLLARELAVSQPTVTDSLHALERKQLIERRRHPGDARRAAVALTPLGQTVVQQIVSAEAAMVDEVASLPVATQEQMLEHALILVARLVSSGFISVARTCLTCRFHEAGGDAGHHCTLLDMPLGPGDLRVNCPEHEQATSAPS